MNSSVTLASTHDSADLQVYLERADRLGCEHVRLQGVGAALAAYIAVFTPMGLLDQAPTVLGLRVYERLLPEATVAVSEIGTGAPLDTTVQVRALLDRLAHDELNIPLPIPQPGVPWSGVSPPRGDWVLQGDIPSATLAKVAKAGIDEVAAANGLGTNIVQTVRQEVWGRPMTDAPSQLPAGAAFAALGLGFLGAESAAASSLENATVATSGTWTRLTTSRGHVLVK